MLIKTGATPTSLASKIIRNAVFGALRYAFVAPIPFLMTPLILHKIGVKGYGTWAVFLAMNGLTSLADLGLFGTLSKFVAEYQAQEDISAISRLLNCGLTWFLLMDFVIATAIWSASPMLSVTLFRDSPMAKSELIFLLRVFVVVITSNVLIQLFASVTTGLQRLDLTNTIGAATVLMSAGISAALLLEGWGLNGLVYGYAFSAVLSVVVYLVTIRRLLPQLRWAPLSFDMREARKIFGFSLRLYVTQAAVSIHNQIEKIFLGIMVGVVPVGWYDIASDVALKIRGTLGFVLAPVLPAASELDALGDERRLTELYYRTHKYLALVGVPAVAYLLAISRRFLELWVGRDLGMLSLPLCILLLINFFNLATGPGFLIFAGRGYLRPGIQSATLAMALNIVLSFGFIYRFGFPGAVLGTALSLFTGSAYFVWVFHRHTRYSFSRLARECYFKPVFCSTLSLAIVLVTISPSALSWPGLVGMGAAFGILYGVGIIVTKFFDAYDWSKIYGVVALLRHDRRGSVA
jgi:O-antigen/teichoic acid export membrane protein